ncbi:MAG: RNA polymerase Rpb4 family protein [Candidatus Micrarchaeota archaeon]|nr:RNA polymerase Rpb4 family protein [Candidatus Micrarchaeota archaeon]
MIGKGASQIRPVTLAEVERILEKRQGTLGEFGFEQQTTLDYAKRFAKLKLSDAQELCEQLASLGIKPETAVKIADILPQNKALLGLILAKDRSDISEKKVAEIEELVAKYAKKAKKIEPLPQESQPEASSKAEGQEQEKQA